MSEISSAAPDAGQSKAVSLLSRVILPRPGEPLDVRKLYIDESTTNARRAHAPTRTTLEIGAESEVSFATYFNAFPASYWRRWSTLSSVVLRVELSGAGRVDVYRSKATGARIAVGGMAFNGQPDVREFEVGLEPFEDGGWIWFDITTDSSVTLHSAGWYAPVPAPGAASVAIGIPTFNRPDDCVNALRALTSDPLVDEVIKAVIVPDQGKSKVRAHPGFDDAATLLGDRLSIHDQPNLGGSGGYSRVMYEALKNTDCEQILFMDDDIRIEPDSILRALALNRFSKAPMLIGGQMLNLQEPAHLHIMGEVVDRDVFMWTAAPHAEYDHDFAKKPLSDIESKQLHRRFDVDGNGWWMCMIPRAVAEEIGLPMPLFIKWDDWEFALRAAEHGYPTTTVPGVAIWHMAWSDKDDAIDWQAYFHLRNRLVVAALHHDGPIDGIRRSMLKATLKHLSCLEYSTVAIQNKAIDDFLAGPEHIFSILESALPDIRAMRNAYPDAVVLPAASALPAPVGKVTAMKPPTNPVTIAIGVARGVLHNLKKSDPKAHVTPQFNIATQDARWFRLSAVDGVTVTTADGRGVVYRQRDRAKMFALLAASLRRHRTLTKRFPEMRRIYRDALPELTSKQKWETVLRAQLEVAGRSAPVTGSPRGEDAALVVVQSMLAGRPGVLTGARALSHFGEHSAGWVGVALLGALLQPRRRRVWLTAGVGAFLAHAAAVVIKRIVKRERPHHPSIMVNVSTPSRLSFPSAHVTSTTAASILLARATGLRLPWVVVPPMALSRLVLGVHYPTDVLTGVAVGTVVATVVGKAAGTAADRQGDR